MVLVDTNVILDVVEDDPKWANWSQSQLERIAETCSLFVNSVVYAELSIAYERQDELDKMLETGGFQVETIPGEALFLAGKVFLRYRRQGGTKNGVLPDFFIGAHAAVLGIPLLTRDLGRYGHYFPNLTLITPQ